MVKFALIGDPQYALREPVEGRYYHLAAGNLKRTLKILDSAELDFVVNLGDLGDGQSRDEIPELLDRYRSSRHAIRHVVGNHDFVQYSHEELLRLLGLAGFFYDFSVKGVRFIVLNGLDVSRFSPPKSRNYREAVKYRERNIFRNLRDWDGMLSEEGFAFLRDRLDRSLAASESAVILCHVPLYSGASGSGAVMWDSARILELLDRYPHVRAVFAGHYHPGGAAVRKGVVHKTVKAICNCMEPTALIARIDGDEITFEPVGEEKAFSYSRSDCASAAVSGRALPESVSTDLMGDEKPSHVYWYLVDENAGTYELVNSFDVPYSSIVSSVQIVGDNYVVNSGVSHVFGEYDSEGNMIRQLEYECTMQGYRVMKDTFEGYWFD